MVPLALSGILCFMNVPLEGVALHAYVAFAYVLYGMSYTGTSMPFGAMASVVSTDPIDRSKLSRARSIGGTLVGMVALPLFRLSALTRTVILSRNVFTMLAVLFGVLCIVCYVLLTKLTIERVRQSENSQQENSTTKMS